MDKRAFMAACREGGTAIEAALRELDRTCFRQLHRECLRVVRDTGLAEDVVQETFIKIWRRCATYRGESEVLAWIRVILRRSLLDRLRQVTREIATDADAMAELIDGETSAVPAASSPTRLPLPEDAARTAELKDCFERCWHEFQRASPAHAAVLGWIVDDGMTNEQIASLLERSPGATREFISQCRKRARIHFVDWYALAFSSDAPA